MRAQALWLVAVLGGGVGCASDAAAPVPDPKRTLARFAEAVEQDDARAAYALLSPRLRAETDWEGFATRWRDNRAELADVARDIRDTDPRASAHARLELANSETVVMVLQDGRWRLAGGVLDAQALSTPLDAVAALRQALLRRSLPSLIRVLSVERRAAWEAAFEQSIDGTADPLDLRVEVRGDEAIVQLTGGGQILLKREAGRWHVWDVR